MVIIKGTEFYDAKLRRYRDFPVTDILQMIGRCGNPKLDDKGQALVLVDMTKRNYYRRYLNDPFPLESVYFLRFILVFAHANSRAFEHRNCFRQY
jgi:activating signal cointegrator complex subunit 3